MAGLTLENISGYFIEYVMWLFICCMALLLNENLDYSNYIPVQILLFCSTYIT